MNQKREAILTLALLLTQALGSPTSLKSKIATGPSRVKSKITTGPSRVLKSKITTGPSRLGAQIRQPIRARAGLRASARISDTPRGSDFERDHHRDHHHHHRDHHRDHNHDHHRYMPSVTQPTSFSFTDKTRQNRRTNRRMIMSGLGVGLGVGLANMVTSLSAEAQTTIQPTTDEKRRTLPLGWQAVRDPESGDTYYWQPSSDITQWEFPSEDSVSKSKVYKTAFGKTVEKPNIKGLGFTITAYAFGLLMLNVGIEYQDYVFPSLKASREQLEYYVELAQKYGQQEDEPLEEAGFRAMEMARKDRISAIAKEVENLMEDQGDDAQKDPDNDRESKIVEAGETVEPSESTSNVPPTRPETKEAGATSISSSKGLEGSGGASVSASGSGESGSQESESNVA